jgi:dUTP pyrophosphatase
MKTLWTKIKKWLSEEAPPKGKCLCGPPLHRAEMVPIACKKIRKEEESYLPTKREEDSDYDLFVSQDVLLRAEDVTEAPTNLAIEYPPGYEGKIEDKSSIARKKITVFGGVIDNGYRGEHIIMMFNASKKDYLIQKGQKIAQLSIRKKTPHRTFYWTAQGLSISERGHGGFGSTGE